MLSRGEESCGEVGLNSGFSGFFMVGDDMSAQRRGKNKKGKWKQKVRKIVVGGKVGKIKPSFLIKWL